MKKIIQFFKFIFSFFTILKFKKINKKLSKKISEQEVDRIILKGLILKACRKYLKIDANSAFIPKDYKNNAEIIGHIRANFGKEMDTLNVRINSKLQFK